MSRLLTQLTALVIALALLTPKAEASGIFSFEQTSPTQSSQSQPQSNCVDGSCPLPSRTQVQPKTTMTVGPATCVAIGQNQQGWTFVLTAGHNIGPKNAGIQYFVIGPDGRKNPAFPFFVNMKNDIAGVLVRSRLSLAVVADRAPTQGEPVVVKGLLSRRFEESSGRVSSSERFVLTIADVWAHPGMSGGSVESSRGFVGIFYGKLPNGDGLATGYQCLVDGVNSFEERFGPLTFKKRETPAVQDVAISDVMSAPYVEGVSPKSSKKTPEQIGQATADTSALSSFVKQLDQSRKDHSIARAENNQLRSYVNSLQVTVNNLKQSKTESQPPPLPREEARPPNEFESFTEPPVVSIPRRPEAPAAQGPGIGSKWVSVLKKVAILAAPEYAIPVTIGLGVLGALWRKRKPRHAINTQRTQTHQSNVVSRPTLAGDGKTTEQTLWRDGVRLALSGHLPVLGSKLVGKAIENYVYSRDAKERGEHIQRG